LMKMKNWVRRIFLIKRVGCAIIVKQLYTMVDVDLHD